MARRLVVWLPIHWTGETIDHIAVHGVTRSEVEAALEGRLYRRKSGEGMRVIGVAGDRCLFIVLRPSRVRPGCAEVATARPASRSEKRLFATRGKGSS